jgi:hypothetical protein
MLFRPLPMCSRAKSLECPVPWMMPLGDMRPLSGAGQIGQGRILQGTRRPRDALTKGCIVQGTHCPRDGTFETLVRGQIGRGYIVMAPPEFYTSEGLVNSILSLRD